jgi:hypothetical protein
VIYDEIKKRHENFVIDHKVFCSIASHKVLYGEDSCEEDSHANHCSKFPVNIGLDNYWLWKRPPEIKQRD